ncbi:hypothetical protein GCM10017714_10620 [Curtobacterium pusillum]|uniref:hypothetical protein n=1 Tax=Curtobacterium pusillum TaxID=69373 RepID=UPI0022F2B71E|nr:hypothetical protein [Curtobacterium pusillum]GLK30322.1 hypothetical protein GCM10017610_06070 [Curtobacterium pusillum]
MRYVRRMLRRGDRAGGLGVDERLSWRFVRYNLRNGASNRRRRRHVFDEAVLPKVLLVGARRIRDFVRAEGLRTRR